MALRDKWHQQGEARGGGREPSASHGHGGPAGSPSAFATPPRRQRPLPPPRFGQQALDGLKRTGIDDHPSERTQHTVTPTPVGGRRGGYPPPLPHRLPTGAPPHP